MAVKGVIGLFSGSNSHLDPIRKIAREVRISRQVDHPHVIKLIDAYVPPVAEFDHVYLMFEHMDKSLWKVSKRALYLLFSILHARKIKLNRSHAFFFPLFSSFYS